jgi:iron(III) transport system substrate-binding protein
MKTNSVRQWWSPMVAISAAMVTCVATAQAQINVMCSVPVAWCEAVVGQYQRETGVRVNMTQKAAGEALAQLVAEKANPKYDVWYAGTGDAHLQAAEQDVTEAYQSPLLPQLHDWARTQAERSKYRTVGLFAGVLGFGYNRDVLGKKNLAPPKCWADLTKPEYKNEVQMANPNASGTAYMNIATFVQLFGEDKAFNLLRAMHKNTNNYPRTGIGAIKAAARGETGIGVTFLDDASPDVAAGFPVSVVAPCEGTGYQVASMSLIKNARNADAARKFYDWALTPASQKLAADTKNYQTMSNRNTPTPALAVKFADVKLIDYDFGKYGDASERKRLLAKWDKEVYAAP